MPKITQIPQFNEMIEAYAIEKLAAGKPPLELAHTIYDRYPEKFMDVEGVDKDRVIQVIYDRLRNRKYDERYSSYWRIKDRMEDIQDEIAVIDIADPIEQVRMCDHLYRELMGADEKQRIDELQKKIPALLKLMGHARKVVEMLIPQDGDIESDPDELPELKR